MVEKKRIHLIIVPTYKTNDNINLGIINNSIDILALEKLNRLLEDIDKHFIINKIDIKGGEISLLSNTYFDLLYRLCCTYTQKVSTWTNLIKFKKSLINTCDIINVMFNFKYQKANKKTVFDNIKAIEANSKVINLKTFDIACDEEQESTIQQINSAGIKSWEILPYHQNINNSLLKTDYSRTENVIKSYLYLCKEMKFSFQNKLQLDGILLEENYSEYKVYILPSNSFALLKFDDHNRFYFQEIRDIYELGFELEKILIKKTSYCNKCKNKLWCLANEVMNLEYDGESCSGLKQLIKEYKGVKR